MLFHLVSPAIAVTSNALLVSVRRDHLAAPLAAIPPRQWRHLRPCRPLGKPRPLYVFGSFIPASGSHRQHHGCAFQLPEPGQQPPSVDTTYGHLSTRSFRITSNNSYTSQTITPKLNAPGNRLLVSFWSLIPQDDTLGRLSVGVHRHYDEMQIDSVNANTIELLSIRSGQSGWQHYTFTTEELDETGMVGVSFKLITPSYHNYYIDDLEITMIPESQDSVSPVVSLAGPTDAFVFVDTLAINASLLQGDTTGLTNSWHSSMADAGNAQFSILNSQFCSSHRVGSHRVFPFQKKSFHDWK